MPTHNGIKITIISQWELRIHPEFPHPESSQFTNRSPGVGNSSAFPEVKSDAAALDSKADRLLGRPSSISVYIPSMSGARFWLRYSVVNAQPESTPWYYFKLYMNGRHITSWGTNTEKKPSGQVMRALFDPSDRWNYKQDGVVYKNNGTEARPFFFAHEVEGSQSAADDGGLIEVCVFRARGRQRKLAQPLEFKPQDQYGIVMPTAGLVDKPQDARFYDWHLKDPKDKPFVTFKFHYRSWESLINLQLIPTDHPRRLLLPSPSILSLNGQSELQQHLQEQQMVEEQNYLVTADDLQSHSVARSPQSLRDSFSSNGSSTPWITNVFDGPNQSARNAETRFGFSLGAQKSLFPNEARTHMPLSRFSQAALERVSPTTKRPESRISERPLPEIPLQGSSLKHSRTTSDTSGTPSLTPSLVQYLDRDTTSPSPVIGVASRVSVGRLGRNKKPNNELEEHEEQEEGREDLRDGGESDMEDFSKLKPLPLTISKRKGIASPPLAGIFSLPNITMRKNRKSTFKSLPKLITSPDVNRYGELPVGLDEDDETLDNMTTLSLSESEWMCRTPSPIVGEPEPAGFGKFWSPGVDKKRPSSKENGSLRRKAIGRYDDARRSEETDESPSGSDLGGVRIKGGNWI